jgi:hypothetical protein
MTTAKTTLPTPLPATKPRHPRGPASENRQPRHAHEKVKQKNRELELISRSCIAINSTLEPARVLGNILEAVRNLFGVVGSSIWLIDRQSGEVVCRQAAGFQRNAVKGWRLAPGEGIAGWVCAHGKSVVVTDTREEPRHFSKVGEKIKVELRAIISVPMRVKGSLIGTLQVVDRQAGRFQPSHRRLLEALAGAAAIAIENARLFEQANREIAQRKRMEKQLTDKSVALEEVNTALNVLLKTRQQDLIQMQDQIVAHVKDLVLPFLEKLRQSRLDHQQAAYVEIIQANIAGIVSPFLRQIPLPFFDLTPMEIQVADLVRKGKSTKEIAQILNASVKTIEAHRNRLRRKLGLTHQRVQLRDYLMTVV